MCSKFSHTEQASAFPILNAATIADDSVDQYRVAPYSGAWSSSLEAHECGLIAGISYRFKGASYAHPFENPTPLSNFLEMLAIFLLPAGLVLSLGEMVGSHLVLRIAGFERDLIDVQRAFAAEEKCQLGKAVRIRGISVKLYFFHSPALTVGSIARAYVSPSVLSS